MAIPRWALLLMTCTGISFLLVKQHSLPLVRTRGITRPESRVERTVSYLSISDVLCKLVYCRNTTAIGSAVYFQMDNYRVATMSSYPCRNVSDVKFRPPLPPPLQLRWTEPWVIGTFTPLNSGLLSVSGHTNVHEQGRQRISCVTISSNDSAKPPLPSPETDISAMRA